MITAATQDYLKVIFKLTSAGRNATTNAIADRMNVSQASVTNMLRKLAELQLIRYTPYYGVALTSAGSKIALETIRHHRLIELYLVEALGYSWDKVHDEAEKLEHVISEEFEDRVAEFLGDPKADPHGAPIPAKDGSMQAREAVALTSVKPGQRARIVQVSDYDPEMLRYLGSIGLYPRVEIEVVEKAPFEGPLSVRVGEVEHHLGRKVTDSVLVLVL